MASTEQALGADVYAARIVRTLNDGFTALMLSVGHRTGLFDVLADLPAASSRRIASAANLDERYVREWLGAMTSARIIEHDANSGTYALPVEYAAVLARGAGGTNLASLAAMLPMLAANEDLVVSAFRSGGGVAYEAYAPFHDAVNEERGRWIDEAHVDALVGLIPGMRQKLILGADVLDVGCGRGQLLNRLAKMYPRSRFSGYDIVPEAIAAAREEADALGLKNVDFEIGDVASLDEPRAYDLITACDSIHDQAFPQAVLRNICEALRDGGSFLMQEIRAESQPFAPMLYAISTMHCIPVAASQEGEALGMMWGEAKMRSLLAAAGFRSPRFERLAGDAWNVYCVAVRSSARH